jgi:hypothetical protein
MTIQYSFALMVRLFALMCVFAAGRELIRTKGNF